MTAGRRGVVTVAAVALVLAAGAGGAVIAGSADDPVLTAAAAPYGAAGEGGGSRAMGSRGRAGGGRGATLPLASDAGPLADAEAATLAFMREEEKLARDVYTVLAGTSGDRRFTNIRRSEQQHMDSVGALLVRYGLPDPADGNGPGEFEDDTLQQQYDALVERGTASREAAIAVGVAIEEMDLRDIASRRASVDHADIAQVLDRLAQGSERHLAAFSR